jgi:hypothetical protein
MMTFRPTLTTRQICIYGVVASILFSLTVLLQQDLLNKDGVLYVGVASLFQNGQISDAFALYSWPFFSLLIAVVDMVTGVGLDSSAYILITLFDAVLLVAFILIVKELGGDARVQVAAIVVIFSLVYMNENRADVIRDHGYWSCYLLSLLLYLKFFKSPGLWLGLGWSATILLGALFRIEGFVVWAVLPLVMLLRSDTSAKAKMQYLFMSYLLHLLIGTVLASYLWITKDDFLLATRLGDFQLLFGNLVDGLGVDMERRISVLKTGVLDANYSAGFARSSIVGIILIILGSKVITTITPPYVGVFLIPSLRARLKGLDPRLILVLVWAGMISLLVVLLFLIPKFFLSARWVLPFALTLLLFMPFMLVQALDNWKVHKEVRRRRTIAIYLIFGLFILYGFLDGLISTSPSKSYVKESGIWIKQNLDKESKVYSNESRIDHYAGRYKRHSGYGKLRPSQWHKYDYLAVRLKRDDAVAMKAINSKAGCLIDIKQFTGPRKAMVKVFRVSHDDGCDNKEK